MSDFQGEVPRGTLLDLGRGGSVGMQALWDIYKTGGVDSVTDTVKRIRRLAGEEEFGGLTPWQMSDRLRVNFPEYLTAVGQRRELVFNQNDPILHDLDKHAIGGLGATSQVGDIWQASSRVASTLPADDIRVGLAVRSTDFGTFCIQQIWERSPDTNTAVAGLEGYLGKAVKIAGLEYEPDQIYEIAQKQAEFVLSWGGIEV